MRPHQLLGLIWIVALGACTPTGVHHDTAAPADTVIMISIDGFRADYLERRLTPTLMALANDGVRAEALKPAFPTLTFPNHYTLVTGLYPDHHGIVNNTMEDPALPGRFALANRAVVDDGRWWDEAEPIWVTAQKHGLKSATMFWPGSEAEIHGYRPNYWKPFDGKISADRRTDQILAWLDLPADQRPQFLTLYFDQVDHAAHADGPDSASVAAAMREVDAALARLVDGLEQRHLSDHVDLVIVSDHGMTATSPEREIYLSKWINLDDVDVTGLGALAGITPKPERAGQIDAALLGAHEHMHCLHKNELPARLHYGSNPRIPPIVCLADDGWLIRDRPNAERANAAAAPLGQHGYDNDDPNMRALFIAHGPAFKSALVVPEFDNVDVYPLLMHVLRIDALRNDGDYAVVSGVLK